MLRVILMCVATFYMAFGPLEAHAEEINVLISQQGSKAQRAQLPEMGLKRNQVKREFGPPESISQSQGQPVIETWRYAEFSVYFEADTVIHSVLHHQAQHLHSPKQ